MLLEMQNDMQRALLGSAPPSGALAAGILGNGLSAAARLQIYRNHLFISLTEALAQTYSTVHRLVGDDFFAGMARAYILAEPPEGPCLAEYGAGLPAFIAGHPNCDALPYLSHVARFDWAINRAYGAADHPVVRLETLGTLPPERLAETRVRLSPTLSLITSPYPLDRIWQANRKPPGEEDVVDLAEGGACFAVWRRADDVVWQRLDRGEETFLTALSAGAGLAEAATQALQHPDTEFSRLLLFVGQGELIAGISSAEPAPATAVDP